MKRILLVLVMASFALTHCASVNMKKASPAEFGYGLQMTPGWQIGDSNTSVHGLLSYARLEFDGGHDNMYQFGGQVRRFLQPDEQRGLWVGGEAAYVRFSGVFDNEDLFGDESSANGFAMAALVGYTFPTRYVPVSGYAGLGFVNFGDFTSGGSVVDTGGTGVTLRAGICLHVLSLLHPKGR